MSAKWAAYPETAAHLATSERHLKRLVYEKRLPYHKVGGKVRFDLDELDAFFKQEQPPRSRRLRGVAS